jgi:serine/threonine-protein kinase RsbW
VIAIEKPPVLQDWRKISFASTLYLCPILDLLLAQIPERWQAELRLGLQEALVNAAKHGNNLDPNKMVEVRYTMINDHHWWIISNQGSGFEHPPCKKYHQMLSAQEYLPDDLSENGRGICLLHQIFDQVHWNNQGRELRLCKQVDHQRQPLIC